MIELPLILAGGLLGSAHCVGMCGGFAVSIGMGTNHWMSNLARQLSYTLGRVFTYCFAGSLAGYAGLRAVNSAWTAGNFQAILSLAAGGLLLVQGLQAAGLLRSNGIRKSSGAFCPAQTFFASFLTAPGTMNAFIAGILTGFLPCGLLYAYLALAASCGTVLGGITTMAAFGAGTAPLLVLTGCGASLLNLASRRRVLNLAAWCVVATGLLTIGRGTAALWQGDLGKSSQCPLCVSSSEVLLITPRGQSSLAKH